MAMTTFGLTMSTLTRAINELLSFLIFSFLDLLDFFLCYVYKIADFVIEAEWKPCYCSSPKGAANSDGKNILTVRMSSTKLRLEEVSDTLYMRPSLVSEVGTTTVNEIKRLKMERTRRIKTSRTLRTKVTVDSTVVEMIQERIGGLKSHLVPRWSDCDCNKCTAWITSSKESLFVQTGGAKDNTQEDVLFIHGFISSSAFWTETLFPNFSTSAKSAYRFFAVDLLGFGKSPKPTDSLYTLREHLDMIESSVLEPYKVKSFHIVAHSLGCILAIALAAKYPHSVKSLTLLAPPYFPVPKGEQGTQYLMRKLAPRRVWPLIAFGASMACWYEHISRTMCLIICKHHRVWEFLIKLITRNRIRTYLIDGFCCHTHNAAWHTLHNIICGTGGKIDAYLNMVRDRKCPVEIFHGENDELIPVECSYNMKLKIPGARVKVIENKDHITIVVGRQKEFARELEEIWKDSRGNCMQGRLWPPKTAQYQELHFATTV